MLKSRFEFGLPKYQCHKVVEALKIAAIYPPQGSGALAGSALLKPDHPAFPSFAVNEEYVRKHRPQVGGYWVRYEDGYESFSPAEAFEGGYTLISDPSMGSPWTPGTEAAGALAPSPAEAEGNGSLTPAKPFPGGVVIFQQVSRARSGALLPAPALIQHVHAATEDSGELVDLWVFGPAGIYLEWQIPYGSGPREWIWPNRR